MTYASEQETDELIRVGKMLTALSLAEQLEKTFQSPLHGKAADELRRLHFANLDCIEYFNAIKAERDELLKVLKELASFVDADIVDADIGHKVRAAIAKAEA